MEYTPNFKSIIYTVLGASPRAGNAFSKPKQQHLSFLSHEKFSLRRVGAEFTPIFKSVIYTVLGALPKAYHVLSKPKR
jgi:hypothetical protein